MTSPARPVLTVSEDGYVRLTEEGFAALPLMHLISCVDAHDGMPAAADASHAITGFTEWVSEGIPAITLGWDWQLLPGAGTPARVNDARTNLMLIDNISGADQSQYKTTTFLNSYIDRMAWQAAAMAGLQAQPPLQS
jgi:hypothetical protein